MRQLWLQLERAFLPRRHAERQRRADEFQFMLLHPFAPSGDPSDPWPTIVCIGGETCSYLGDQRHVGINRRAAAAVRLRSAR